MVAETPFIVSRETQARLDDYIALLSRWNRTLNLVAPGDLAAGLHDRHLRESLALIAHITPGCDRFIDLGSGGGFPAIPIAIASGMHADLIEADRRKAAFLETVLATLGVRGTVWPDRIEMCRVPPASCITARAVATLSRLLDYAAPHLRPGGVLVLLKGARLEAELAEARTAWAMQADIIAPWPTGSRILKISRLKPAHGDPD